MSAVAGAYLTSRGIMLAHTPDVLTETTADTIFSLILGSARRVVELAEFVKAGRWIRSIGEPLYGVNVHSKTIGMLGQREFALMRPGAIFINGSRGKIVDEAVLIAALQQGLIHRAGLDVFEQEPVAVDSPLLRMPNVLVLPHIGSATHETRFAMAEMAVESPLAGLRAAGQPGVRSLAAALAILESARTGSQVEIRV